MSDAYDPNAPEDRRSNQYISRRDVRIVGIVLIVLAIAAWPIYRALVKGVEETTCRRHLRKIGSALLQYAADYEDRLPYAYEIAGLEGNQVNPHQGLANSWHWAVQPYLNDDELFRCPAADPSSNTRVAIEGTAMAVSYGMLNAYSGVAMGMIPSPGGKIVVSETIKGGREGSYDPLPLTVSGKPMEDDGFVIGFDNAQTYPVYTDPGKTRFATRLAIPDCWTGSGNPVFKEDTETRHPNGICFLYLDGHVEILKAPAAKVNLPGGPYDVPPKARLISPTLLKP